MKTTAQLSNTIDAGNGPRLSHAVHSDTKVQGRGLILLALGLGFWVVPIAAFSAIRGF
jgi:hypothetical protein